MDSKFTPGPWEWLYRQDVEFNKNDIVYSIHPVMRKIDGMIENEADARLMASAPVLLEALQKLTAAIQTTYEEMLDASDDSGWAAAASVHLDDNCDTAMEKARTAIAKATKEADNET